MTTSALSPARVDQLAESIATARRNADSMPIDSRQAYMHGWLGGELMALVRELAGEQAAEKIKAALKAPLTEGEAS